MIYCFKCKQQNGKYYRVMDERMEFPYNPNSVLLCDSFPMVRLSQPIKNAVGAVKQIYLKGIWRGNARILFSRQLLMSEITPDISYPVSNLSPDELRKQIRSSTKNRPGINWETQQLDYIVLQYIKESKEPTLFK